MTAKTESRKAMKAIYCAQLVAELAHRAMTMREPMKSMASVRGAAMIAEEAKRIPACVFCPDKPEIDKRRAKRYHRKYLAVSQNDMLLGPNVK